METDLILQVLNTLGIFTLGGLYLSSYLREKGKNLATKEDIAGITREIEGVKAAFIAQQTRFSVFHQRQFKVIGGTYRRLREAQELVTQMTNPVQFGGEPAEAARVEKGLKAFNDLAQYYWGRKLYLPETICEPMENLLKTIQLAATKYQVATWKINASPNRAEHWMEAHNAMTGTVPPMLNDLEVAMRDLVTVTVC